MNVTMKEIADLCGVSRGTVDRVLNNRGHVSPQTEEHIRSVARSMGYHSANPPVMETGTAADIRIGVLVNAIDHPFFAEILNGMIHSLEEFSDYHVSHIIKLSESFDVDQQLQQLDDLLLQGVKAIAITPANNIKIAEKLSQISNQGIPVVIVNSLLDGFEPFAEVSSDHYMSGRVAANFARLLIQPKSKIGIVTSSNDMPGVALRLQGFIDVLQESKENYTILNPIQCFDDDVIAYKSLSGLILRHPDIDLLFLAAGGYNGSFQALEDAQLLHRIKILSFDTNEGNLARLKDGSVAALFSQHPAQLGETAIKILTDFLLKHIVPAKRKFHIPIEILLAESVSSHE